MRCQPRLKVKREPLPSCVIKSIREAVERDARRWECSRSWIIATALAAFYDIDIVQPFEVKKRKKRAA